MKKRLSLRKIDKICIWFFSIIYPLVCGGSLFIFEWLKSHIFYVISGGKDTVMPSLKQRLWDILEWILSHNRAGVQGGHFIVVFLVFSFVLYLVLARPKPGVALLAFTLPVGISRLFLWVMAILPLCPGKQLGFKYGWWYYIELYPQCAYTIKKILFSGVLLYAVILLASHFLRRRPKDAENPTE